MPREDDEFLFTAVKQHLDMVGDAGGHGDTHEPPHCSHLPESWNVSAFERVRVDIEQSSPALGSVVRATTEPIPGWKVAVLWIAVWQASPRQPWCAEKLTDGETQECTMLVT